MHNSWCDLFSQHWFPQEQNGNTVDFWYLLVCGSKETTTEEKPQMLRIHRVQYSKIIQIYLYSMYGSESIHNLKPN
jgi:hypothetical protein